ncbi:MAG: hypothetical protein AAB798_00865 [Patescibacteria group bacterium]
MQYFDSPLGRIAISEERKRHILAFHPDVIPCLRYLADTLSDPEFSMRSVNDASVTICYRSIPRRRIYLAVVVKTGSRPFILTAYLVQKPKRRTM